MKAPKHFSKTNSDVHDSFSLREKKPNNNQRINIFRSVLFLQCWEELPSLTELTHLDIFKNTKGGRAFFTGTHTVAKKTHIPDTQRSWEKMSTSRLTSVKTAAPHHSVHCRAVYLPTAGKKPCTGTHVKQTEDAAPEHPLQGLPAVSWAGESCVPLTGPHLPHKAQERNLHAFYLMVFLL